MQASEAHELEWHKRTNSTCNNGSSSASSSSSDAQELAEGWLPVHRHSSDAAFLATVSPPANATRSNATAPGSLTDTAQTVLSVVTNVPTPQIAVMDDDDKCAKGRDANIESSPLPLPSAAPVSTAVNAAVVLAPLHSSLRETCPPYAAELLHDFARQLDDAMLDEVTCTWQSVLQECLLRKAWLVWRFSCDAQDVLSAGDFLTRLIRRYDLQLPTSHTSEWRTAAYRGTSNSTPLSQHTQGTRRTATVYDVVRVLKRLAQSSMTQQPTFTPLVLLQCLRYLRRLVKFGATDFVCEVLFTTTSTPCDVPPRSTMTEQRKEVSLWHWLQAQLHALDVCTSTHVPPLRHGVHSSTTTCLLSTVRLQKQLQARLVTTTLVMMQSILHEHSQDVVCALVRMPRHICSTYIMHASPSSVALKPTVSLVPRSRPTPMPTPSWIDCVSCAMRNAVHAVCSDDSFALSSHSPHWRLLLLGCTHLTTLITTLFERPMSTRVTQHDVSCAAHVLLKQMTEAGFTDILVRLLLHTHPSCPKALRQCALHLMLQVLFYAVFVCIGTSHSTKRNTARRCLAVWRTPRLFDIIGAVLTVGNDAVQALLAANTTTTTTTTTTTSAHAQGDSCSNSVAPWSAHIASETRQQQHTNAAASSSLLRHTSQRMNIPVGISGRSVTHEAFEPIGQVPTPTLLQQQHDAGLNDTHDVNATNNEVPRSATSLSLLGNRTPSQTRDDPSTSGLSGMTSALHDLFFTSGSVNNHTTTTNTATATGKAASCVVHEELHVSRCHRYDGAVRSMALVLQCMQQVICLCDGMTHALQVDLLRVILRGLVRSRVLSELQRLLGLVVGPFSALGESYKRSRSSADVLEQSCLLRPRMALPNQALRHVLHHIVYAERASVQVLHALLERLPQHACGVLAQTALQRALKTYIEHISSAYLTENLSRRSVTTLGDALDCLRILCSENSNTTTVKSPKADALRQTSIDVWAEPRAVPAAARLSLSQSMNSNVSTSHAASVQVNTTQAFPFRSPSLTPSIPVTSTYLISSSFASTGGPPPRRQSSLGASVMLGASYYCYQAGGSNSNSERHGPVMATSTVQTTSNTVAASVNSAARATLVIEDGKFVSALARMVSRPVMSCQNVPLRALHLINRILTCPSCPASRRLGLMINTRYVLSSLITTMTGRDWAVLQDPPHLTDTTTSTSAAVVAIATANNASDLNTSRSAAEQQQAERHHPHMSRAAQLRSCAWVQQELQVNCVRLVRRWLSATRVPTKSATTTSPWGPSCAPADFLTALLKSTLFLPFIERTLTLGVRTLRQVNAEAELDCTSVDDVLAEKAEATSAPAPCQATVTSANDELQPERMPCYVTLVQRQLGISKEEEENGEVGDAPLWWRARHRADKGVSHSKTNNVLPVKPHLASSMNCSTHKRWTPPPPVMSSTAFELRLLHEVLLLLQEVALSGQTSLAPTRADTNIQREGEEGRTTCTITQTLLADNPVLLLRLVELFQTALTQQLAALQQGSYPYTTYPTMLPSTRGNSSRFCETQGEISTGNSTAARRNYELFLLVLETLATMLGYDKTAATVRPNASRPEEGRANMSHIATSLPGSPDDLVLQDVPVSSHTDLPVPPHPSRANITETALVYDTSHALAADERRSVMQRYSEAGNATSLDRVLVDTSYAPFYHTHYHGGGGPSWQPSLFASHSGNDEDNSNSVEDDMTDDSSRTTSSESRSNEARTADQTTHRHHRGSFASISHTHRQGSREDSANDDNNNNTYSSPSARVERSVARAAYRTPPPHVLHAAAPIAEPALPQGRAVTLTNNRPTATPVPPQQQRTTTPYTVSSQDETNSNNNGAVSKLCGTIDVHLLDDYLRGVWLWLQRNASKECGSLYMQGGGSEVCGQSQIQLQQSHNEGVNAATTTLCGSLLCGCYGYSCSCQEGRALEMSCMGLGASVRGESATASVAVRLTRASDRVRFLIKRMKRCHCNAASS